MMIKDFIKTNVQELGVVPGIYYLYEGGELVYVGQTSNLNARLKSHLKDFNLAKRAMVDGFAILHTAEEDLTRIESEVMFRHEPKYNESMVSGADYQSINAIKNLLKEKHPSTHFFYWVPEYVIQDNHIRVKVFKGTRYYNINDFLDTISAENFIPDLLTSTKYIKSLIGRRITKTKPKKEIDTTLLSKKSEMAKTISNLIVTKRVSRQDFCHNLNYRKQYIDEMLDEESEQAPLITWMKIADELGYEFILQKKITSFELSEPQLQNLAPGQ